MIAVTISGKAWYSEPIGADPCYVPEEIGMQHLQKSAVKVKRGKGVSVTLRGDEESLLRLAHWYQCDGEAWLSQCDSAEAKREARACLKAAAVIRKAVDEG